MRKNIRILIDCTSMTHYNLESGHLGINTSCDLPFLVSQHLGVNTSCDLPFLLSQHLGVNTSCDLPFLVSQHLGVNTSYDLPFLVSQHLGVNTSCDLPSYCLNISGSTHLVIYPSWCLNISGSTHLVIYPSWCLNISGSTHIVVNTSCDYPFGSSDPLTQGLPEWEQQPEPNYYVVKNQPVTITCRATPAIQITFKCVGHQIPNKNIVNKEKIDPRTRRKTLESSIEVTREERDEYYGTDGYWCECTAWNNVQGTDQPQSIKSTRGVVETAFLRKRFERVPNAKRVEEGASVELACLPPEGKPLPTVSVCNCS
ncbi:Netrin receptor unc5b [Biomphalaria glabrata]